MTTPVPTQNFKCVISKTIDQKIKIIMSTFSNGCHLRRLKDLQTQEDKKSKQLFFSLKI